MNYEEDAFDKFMERYIGTYVDRIDVFYRNELGITNDFLSLITYVVIFVIIPFVIYVGAVSLFSLSIVLAFLSGLFVVWLLRNFISFVKFLFGLIKVANKFPKYLTGGFDD